MMDKARLDHIINTTRSEAKLLKADGYSPGQIILSLLSAAACVSMEENMGPHEFRALFDRIFECYTKDIDA